MGTMNFKSSEEFKTAKRRFEIAREKASEAFCNDALSINDQIFAAKVRVVSEILEHLESLQIAIVSQGVFRFLKIYISYQLSVTYSQRISKAQASRCSVKMNE
jgi:hypothetical protein